MELSCNDSTSEPTATPDATPATKAARSRPLLTFSFVLTRRMSIWISSPVASSCLSDHIASMARSRPCQSDRRRGSDVRAQVV